MDEARRAQARLKVNFLAYATLPLAAVPGLAAHALVGAWLPSPAAELAGAGAGFLAAGLATWGISAFVTRVYIPRLVDAYVPKE